MDASAEVALDDLASAEGIFGEAELGEPAAAGVARGGSASEVIVPGESDPAEAVLVHLEHVQAATVHE